MNLLVILLIILLICGSGWGYSSGYHGPASLGAILLIILIVLLLTGRL